jgi:hypothetical protein
MDAVPAAGWALRRVCTTELVTLQRQSTLGRESESPAGADPAEDGGSWAKLRAGIAGVRISRRHANLAIDGRDGGGVTVSALGRRPVLVLRPASASRLKIVHALWRGESATVDEGDVVALDGLLLLFRLRRLPDQRPPEAQRQSPHFSVEQETISQVEKRILTMQTGRNADRVALDGGVEEIERRELTDATDVYAFEVVRQSDTAEPAGADQASTGASSQKDSLRLSSLAGVGTAAMLTEQGAVFHWGEVGEVSTRISRIARRLLFPPSARRITQIAMGNHYAVFMSEDDTLYLL